MKHFTKKKLLLVWKTRDWLFFPNYPFYYLKLLTRFLYLYISQISLLDIIFIFYSHIITYHSFHFMGCDLSSEVDDIDPKVTPAVRNINEDKK